MTRTSSFGATQDAAPIGWPVDECAAAAAVRHHRPAGGAEAALSLRRARGPRAAARQSRPGPARCGHILRRRWYGPVLNVVFLGHRLMEPVAILQHLWLLVCRPADRANQAVTALLRRVDENVEQLYPNLRMLIKEKPLYNDLAIARRLDLLRIWNNMMYLLRVRREMLEGWMYNAAGLGIGRSARAARLKLFAPAVCSWWCDRPQRCRQGRAPGTLWPPLGRRAVVSGPRAAAVTHLGRAQAPAFPRGRAPAYRMQPQAFSVNLSAAASNQSAIARKFRFIPLTGGQRPASQPRDPAGLRHDAATIRGVRPAVLPVGVCARLCNRQLPPAPREQRRSVHQHAHRGSAGPAQPLPVAR